MDILLPIYILIRYFNKRKYKRIHTKFQSWVQNQAKEKSQYIKKKALFYPELPETKSALAIALKTMGYQIHNDPTQEHHFAVAWDNETWKTNISELSEVLQDAWNSKCHDISKSYLDQVHQEVFDYSTRVNPALHTGDILEKSEINASHQARIVHAPLEPKEGFIYQKLINNAEGRYFFKDIRLVYIRGKIPCCYLNYRIKGKRFSAKKYKAVLVNTDTVLTKEEQALTHAFCQKLHVDYAEIDALRDNDSGLLYLIDVNVTAFGPSTGLTFQEKIEAVDLYHQNLKASGL